MLIDVKNLTLGYEKENVIENVSFTVNKGDFIIIVGANGAGKSTLIKGILGLIPIYSGDIIFDNSLKRNEIGYMPQETKVDSSFPASVSEIVLSGTLARNKFKLFYNKKDKEDATNALKILNIYDIKNKSFQDLSGGQRQKVLLARSLCATEDLLILDEPSNNLDQESKVEFYTTLKHLNEGHNMTIIMITHDIERDRDSFIGNKVLELKKGGYFYGLTEEYMEEN